LRWRALALTLTTLTILTIIATYTPILHNPSTHISTNHTTLALNATAYLTIYKIVNGRKILVYRGIDPPTRNFWSLLLYLAFHHNDDIGVVTTDGTSYPYTWLPFRRAPHYVCIGTGSTPSNVFDLYNLVSPLACEGVNNAYSETQVSSGYVVTVDSRALFTFSGSHSITEIGVEADETHRKKLLLFYTHLPQPIEVNSTTALLVDYKFVIHVTEPMLLPFARLVAVIATGSGHNVPNEAWFSDERYVHVCFAPYQAYTPLLTHPSSCIDDVNPMGMRIASINATVLNLEMFISPSKNITAGGAFVELRVAYTTPQDLDLFYVPLSSSGIEISTDKYLDLDIVLRVS